MQKNKNYLIVVVLAIIGTMSAALMASCVKYLSTDLNPFITCFYRSFFGLIIILPFVSRQNFKALKTNNFKLQFYRSMINIVSMICWFTALGMMQLEKATALGFTTPLFTTILAVILLGEVIRAHRIAALCLGFIGILVIIRPGYLPFENGTMLMLVASLSFSVVLILVKKLSGIDTSLTIIFYQLLFMTPILFIISLFFWEGINLDQFLLFILMGSTGLLSHWSLAQCFKMSDTTFVMPLQFTKLIWVSLIAYYLFYELPNIWTWIGGAIIFFSVIYITYREAFVKKDAPETKQIDRAIIT